MSKNNTKQVKFSMLNVSGADEPLREADEACAILLLRKQVAGKVSPLRAQRRPVHALHVADQKISGHHGPSVNKHFCLFDIMIEINRI